MDFVLSCLMLVALFGVSFSLGGQWTLLRKRGTGPVQSLLLLDRIFLGSFLTFAMAQIGALIQLTSEKRNDFFFSPLFIFELGLTISLLGLSSWTGRQYHKNRELQIQDWESNRPAQLRSTRSFYWMQVFCFLALILTCEISSHLAK